MAPELKVPSLIQLEREAYMEFDSRLRPAVMDFTRYMGWKIAPSAPPPTNCGDSCATGCAARSDLRPSRAAAPVTKGLPFIDSPTPLLMALGLYLWIVAFGLMRADKPVAEKARPMR